MTLTRPLRLGTRGSALARAQSQTVADRLAVVTGRPVELVEVVTAGDRSHAPVTQLGVGVFVSALRDALLAGEIDFAVHSYKDLPTAPAEKLVIAAVPLRADPRDVLVAADGIGSLAALPDGARIGTGAPRRVAQLRALGRGFDCVPIRGNVDTRLGKVANGELDAVVLAYAGLDRLGRAAEATERLDPNVMLPAPAQGALAIECRAADTTLATELAELDHLPTRAAVVAERTLLAALEAGCSAPVAALAQVGGAGFGADPSRAGAGVEHLDAAGRPGESATISLRGAVFALDGSAAVQRTGTGTLTAHSELVGAASTAALAGAEELGRLLAAELLADGADSLLGEAR